MGADDYAVEVPLNQALFGFGDAVCVPVIEWIARNYLNPVMNERRACGIPSPCPVANVNYRKSVTRDPVK
jgi:DNA (cytosine-5)-methyltransferase 1